MTRTQLALLTLGDPARVTGGYLFHGRLADRAPQHGMQISFVSVPDVPLAWAMLTGLRWLRHPAIERADALVLDSIAAAPAAPWLGRLRMPILGMLHQPLGGMDTGQLVRSVRSPFDRWAYQRARLLMVASEWLAEQLGAAGIPRSRLLGAARQGPGFGAGWLPGRRHPADDGGTASGPSNGGTVRCELAAPQGHPRAARGRGAAARRARHAPPGRRDGERGQYAARSAGGWSNRTFRGGWWCTG